MCFLAFSLLLSSFTSNGIFYKTASALNISMTACPIGIKCFIGHLDKEIVHAECPGSQEPGGDNSIAEETYSVCYADTGHCDVSSGLKSYTLSSRVKF